MWRTYSSRLKEPPPDGTQVFVFGVPTVWEERGEFRLNVTELLVTDQIGKAQLELERIRKALEKDGLFDPARKRSLPPLPERIAVVTSLDGAAMRDIITVTRKRWPAVELLVVGTKVQGAEAVGGNRPCARHRESAGANRYLPDRAWRRLQGGLGHLQQRSGVPRARCGPRPHRLGGRTRDRCFVC